MQAPTARQIKATREKLGMSQGQFAKAFRLNVRTLQGWEIGNSRSGVATKVLMWLICHAPETVLKLLKGAG